MTNPTAVVTGAAGGIGGAVVRALAAAGVPVAAFDARGDALQELARPLRAAGHRISVHPVDVTCSREVDAAVDRVEREDGPIGSLVNAAGVLRLAEAVDLSDQEWRTTFAVNADGVFHVSRAVARRMVTRRRGAIVTVASNAATVPRWSMAAYAASKAAATSFTKSLGLELSRHGIRCNVVAPGSTDTPMLAAMGHDGDTRAASVRGTPDEFRVGIPLGRLASPEDVADAVLFLLSERSAHITLHDLTVDGGAALGR